MHRLLSLTLLALILGAAASAAQDTPYAGLETREIKALSAERIAGYLNGQGMGYALAAELNSYPGPKHVLQLADSLALTAQQREHVRAVLDAMHADAVRLGREIVSAEGRLDSLFATGAIDDASLEETVAELGRFEGRLRYVHLRAHLATRAALTAHQRMRYDQLRGYGAGHGAEHRHGATP
ncbi:MAG: hypothetical protein PVF27_09260 [Gemmatimonadales bacterium]|jgi:Spy/CpxP family protein refolding chaperone